MAARRTIVAWRSSQEDFCFALGLDQAAMLVLASMMRRAESVQRQEDLSMLELHLNFRRLGVMAKEFRRVVGWETNVDGVPRTPLLNASSFQRKLSGYNRVILSFKI